MNQATKEIATRMKMQAVTAIKNTIFALPICLLYRTICDKVLDIGRLAQW